MTKKVLLISVEFPPRKMGNVRFVKFARYLLELGWQVYVLTVSERSIWEFDRSVEIPSGTKVYRAFRPNPFVFLDRRWHEKDNLRTKENLGHKESLPAAKAFPSPLERFKKAATQIITQFRRYFFIPTEEIMWLPFAVIKGTYLCFKEKVDLIYSTAPDFTNHLVAGLISLLTGKKWVAEYRNFWTDNPTRPHRTRWHKVIEEGLDWWVLKRSTAIVVIAEAMKEALLERRSFLCPERIISIDNGYDRPEFDSLSAPPIESRQFLISYTGALYADYPTPAFLVALGELFQEDPKMKQTCRVDFCGMVKDQQKREVTKIIRQFGLGDNVRFLGEVPRPEALRLLLKSDLLLLLFIVRGNLPNLETVVPGKVFDYIAARKPILAIVPQGMTTDIIREGRLGIAVNTDEVSRIKDALRSLYQEHTEGGIKLEPDWDYLERFDRSFLTQRLSDFFEEVLERT
ncbi:MAG: glycosyltransferase [bacterium]